MKRFKIIGIIVIGLVVGAIGYYLTGPGVKRQADKAEPASNVVTYFCREGVVQAAYLDQKVRLTLPDGRKLVLSQAASGSGIRYTDGKSEFWSKGNNGWVVERNKLIYSDGIAGMVTHPSPGISQFTDDLKSFSFGYPRGFALSGKDIGFTQAWRVGTTDYGQVLAMVTVPKSYLPRTNFSGAEFTIGQSSDPRAVKDCFVTPQGYGVQTEQVKLGGVAFTKYTFSDAAAGNRYDTTSYRTKRGDDCYVVEYTIHSTNIGNYSSGQGIKEFDKVRIIEVLEGMVRSFKFLQ